MSTTEVPGNASVDMKLEAVVIPVSDVDSAKEFYASLGWRLDADIGGGDLRIVQFNPPGAPVFHDAGGGFNRFDPNARASGPDPERHTYASFASFSDPDGNEWQLQEITNRIPGRVDPATTTYSSVGDLTTALKRAAAAHGKHEERTGQADANWPEWYAAYMVAEATGGELPT